MKSNLNKRKTVMIFSRELFDDCAHSRANPKNDFSRIAAYKSINFLFAQHASLASRKEMALAYFYDWRTYNYRTRLNLFDMKFRNKKIYKIPYYQKNRVIIEAKIRDKPSEIGFIPEDLMEGIYTIMAMNRGNHKLKYIPDRLKTKNMVLLSVSTNIANFYHIPDSMLTPDFIIELISRVRAVVDYIPYRLMTPEVKEAMFKMLP